MPLNDDMDFVCERFMKILHKDYPNRQAEISPNMLVKYTKRFQSAYGIKHQLLLDALIRRQWFEPSAADTFIVRFDLVRK